MRGAAIIGGMAGAGVATAINESMRRVRKDAPRADVLGERVVARVLRAMDIRPPKEPQLYRAALTADLVSNSLYYSLVGRSLARALAMGLGAGVGAVLLPPFLGLGRDATSRTRATAAMTIAWYTLASLAAWLATKAASSGSDD